MSGISRMDPCLILGRDSPKVDPGKSRHVFAIGFCLEKLVFSPIPKAKAEFLLFSQGNPGSDGPPGRDGAAGVKVSSSRISQAPEFPGSPVIPVLAPIPEPKFLTTIPLSRISPGPIQGPEFRGFLTPFPVPRAIVARPAPWVLPVLPALPALLAPWDPLENRETEERR